MKANELVEGGVNPWVIRGQAELPTGEICNIWRKPSGMYKSGYVYVILSLDELAPPPAADGWSSIKPYKAKVVRNKPVTEDTAPVGMAAEQFTMAPQQSRRTPDQVGLVLTAPQTKGPAVQVIRLMAFAPRRKAVDDDPDYDYPRWPESVERTMSVSGIPISYKNAFTFKSHKVWFIFHKGVTEEQARSDLQQLLQAVIPRVQSSEAEIAQKKIEAPARRKDNAKYYAQTAKEKKEELYKKWGKDIVDRVTARQVDGNDGWCWNVLIDGRPMIDGLQQRQVPYYKEKAYKLLSDRFENAKVIQEPQAPQLPAPAPSSYKRTRTTSANEGSDPYAGNEREREIKRLEKHIKDAEHNSGWGDNLNSQYDRDWKKKLAVDKKKLAALKKTKVSEAANPSETDINFDPKYIKRQIKGLTAAIAKDKNDSSRKARVSALKKSLKKFQQKLSEAKVPAKAVKHKYPSTPAGQAAYDNDFAAGKVGKKHNVKDDYAEMGMAAHQPYGGRRPQYEDIAGGKFNVGDEVRINSHAHPYHMESGKVVAVNKDNGNGVDHHMVKVKLNRMKGFGGPTKVFWARDLELENRASVSEAASTESNAAEMKRLKSELKTAKTDDAKSDIKLKIRKLQGEIELRAERKKA